MPHCVAHGCNNKSNNNTNVSYFTLPDPEKDPHKYKAWFCAIGRESLPKHGRICSNHFTEDSYELTSILKAKHCELQSTKMKLKKDAIPSIFAHKPLPKKRTRSVKRSQKQEQDQVCTFNFGKLVFRSQPRLQGLFCN